MVNSVRASREAVLPSGRKGSVKKNKRVTKPAPIPVSWQRAGALCVVLSCVALALYWPARSHPFADYDDDNYVTANPNVQAGLTWKSASWALTSTEKSNWHPLTWISHELDCQLYGLKPAGHHLTSVILHTINVALLFLVLVYMTGAMEQSFLVALLFAVHPLNVESVVWIAERKNVLSTVFFLLAIRVYAWYARKPSAQRYALLTLMFALALGSKPMAITLPGVLLLLDYWPLQRVAGSAEPDFFVPQKRWTQLVLEKLPLFALSALSAVVTIVAQSSGGSIKSLSQLSFGVRVNTAIWAYGEYVFKFLWPVALAPHYPHPGTLAFWNVLLAAVFLIVVSTFVWRGRRHRYLLVGWCWFLGTLVPVIGLIQVGNQAIADRYMYLPIIGLLVMLVWGAYDLAQTPSLQVGVRTGFAAAGLVLLLLTYRQIGFWKSSYDLWSHTLSVTRNNSLAENNLGVALMRLARDDEGLAHFQNAARIDPNDPTGRLNAAAVLQRHGQLEPAMFEYLSVITLASENPNAVANSKVLMVALANLGTLYSETGKYAEARETYQQALEISPMALNSLINQFYQFAAARPSANSFVCLAEMLEEVGRVRDAKTAYAQALVLEPKLTEAQLGMERVKELANNSGPSR